MAAKIPGLTIIPTATAISNFFTASVFGIVLAYSLYVLNNKNVINEITARYPSLKELTEQPSPS